VRDDVGLPPLLAERALEQVGRPAHTPMRHRQQLQVGNAGFRRKLQS
jgi:hypothetical protein